MKQSYTRLVSHCCLSLAGFILANGSMAAATLTLPQGALSSSPGVYTAGGYYTNNLGSNIVTTGGGNGANVGLASGRNDDGFMELNLGFNFTLFNTTYNSLFINNNGNVSFGSGIADYIPTGLTGADASLISPFFSDVDTRDASSGVTHYQLTSNQLVVTWDNVGRYDTQVVPPSNSFQLVLRADNYAIPNSEGKIGFFYQTMGWEVTDTSVTAAVGFGDGLGNAEVIAGSNLPGINNAVNNKYIWFDASLTPVPPTNIPEPETLSLATAGGIVYLLFRLRKTCYKIRT